MLTANAFTDAPAALDSTVLSSLRELDPDGRHGVVQRVLETYEKSLVQALQVLDKLAATPDAAAAARSLRELAHTLKSSSGSVGALALMKLSADVDNELRQNPQVALTPLVQSLLAGCSWGLQATRTSLAAHGVATTRQTSTPDSGGRA